MKQTQIEHREEERKIAESLYYEQKVFIPILQTGRYNVRRVIRHLVEMSIEINITKYEDAVINERVKMSDYNSKQGCIFKIKIPKLIYHKNIRNIVNGGIYLLENEYFRERNLSFKAKIKVTSEYNQFYKINLYNYYYESTGKSDHYVEHINKFLAKFSKRLINSISETMYQDFKKHYLS